MREESPHHEDPSSPVGQSSFSHANASKLPGKAFADSASPTSKRGKATTPHQTSLDVTAKTQSEVPCAITTRQKTNISWQRSRLGVSHPQSMAQVQEDSAQDAVRSAMQLILFQPWLVNAISRILKP